MNRLENPPKYKIGQKVKVNLEAEYSEDIKIAQTVEGFISIIRASGTSEKDTYEYGITTDMPACYHNGKNPFTYIYEDGITLAE